MTKITIDRAIVEQALEFVTSEGWGTTPYMDVCVYEDAALLREALRVALAEQPQDWDETDALRESLREHMAEIHRLRAELAAHIGGANEMVTTNLESRPVEPVAWASYDLDGMVEAFSRVIESHHSSKHPFHNPINMDAQTALRILRRFIPAMKVSALSKAEPVQEPVAKVELMMTGGNAGLATRIVEIDDHVRERLRPGQLLYTTLPKRKPLTDEEALRLWAGDVPRPVIGKNKVLSFTRALERAHGIGDA